MTLKLYTFQYRHTGKTYRATGHTAEEAAMKIDLPQKDLVLQLLETIPLQARFTSLDNSISPHTVPYHSPRK